MKEENIVNIVHWSIYCSINASSSSSPNPKEPDIGSILSFFLYSFQMYTPDETTWSVLPFHLEHEG